jgi:Zn finger protein HypA/HybF involved in hydrogenase expression
VATGPPPLEVECPECGEAFALDDDDVNYLCPRCASDRDSARSAA